RQRARVLGRLQRQDVVVFFRDVVGQRPVAGRDEVRVGVDEPGQDRGGAIIVSVDRGTGRRVDVRGAAEGRDAVTVDEQRRLLDGRGAAAVEQTRGRDQRVAGSGRAHRGRQSITIW